MAKKKKKEVETGRILGRLNDDGSITPFIQKQQEEDIAPVRNDNKWFKNGIDTSGYDIQNPLDAINRFNASVLMTGVDIIGQVGLGVTKPIEGVGDFAQNRVADVLDFFGGDKTAEKIRKSAAKEWGVNRELEQSLARDNDRGIDDMSFLGTKGKSIPQGVGSVLLAMGSGGLGGAIGGTNAAASVASLGIMGVGSAGNAEQEALEQGATRGEARLYGILSGASETLSEMMFGGLSKGSQVLGIGTGLFDSADDAIINSLTKKINNRLVRTFTQAGLKATSEGIEEVVSGLGSAWAKKLTYMKEEDIKKLIEDENLLDSFLSGTLSAAVSQAPNVAQNITTKQDGKLRLQSNNEIRDFITNLNEQEQQVVEREIENRLGQEEKVTKKRRIEIEKQVIEDLDRGYINANTIRDVLGDNYNAERDVRLNESFNEETRRTQAYENDLSKYDEKQRKVIQTAIDSGLLNNSNKTHDMVDLIAKLSADKGVDFDFTNNERIKDSGFAIDGRQVNGFVKDGTVNLNLESNQVLNKTVGHEITHVLEGTELYDNLQQSLKAYIGEKEWNNRISQLEKVYKDVKGADIQNELTSDLVGEHIFNDENFIRNLSTKNPNLFQKIFDEIKYMVKIATAGSKEARDLEKVKRAFEKAYRETSKTQEGTQYSIKQNKQMLEKQFKELTGDSKMVADAKMGRYAFQQMQKQNGNFEGEVEAPYSQEAMQLYEDIENSRKTSSHLYHSTPVDRIQSIVQNGLQVGSQQNQEGVSSTDKLYLSATEELAESFTPNDSVTLRISPNANLENLDNDLLGGEGSYTITNNIDPKYLQVKENGKWVNLLKSQYAKQNNQNTRYSLSVEEANTTQDNEGRKLNENQLAYFKDSKAVDENGNLVTVYHTMTNTGNQFFEFNPVGTDFYRFGDQVVNYFTDNQDMSGSYADSNYKRAYTKPIKSMEDVQDFIKFQNTQNDSKIGVNGITSHYSIEKNGDGFTLKQTPSGKEFLGYDNLSEEGKVALNRLRANERVQKEFEKSSNPTVVITDTLKGWDIVREYKGYPELAELVELYDRESQKLIATGTTYEEQMVIREILKNDLENYLFGTQEYSDEKVNEVIEHSLTKQFENEQDLIDNIQNNFQAKYQYAGYINMTNPYVIDTFGENWDSVTTERNEAKSSEYNRVVKDNETKEKLYNLAQESERLFKEYSQSNKPREFAEYSIIKNKINNSELREVVNDMGMFGLTYEGWLEAGKKNAELFGEEYKQTLPNSDEKITNYTESLNPAELELVQDLTIGEFVNKYGELYKENMKFGDSSSYFKDQFRTTTGTTLDTDKIGYSNMFDLARYNFDGSSVSEFLDEKLTTNDLVKRIIEKNNSGETNYDGLIMKNVYDYGGQSNKSYRTTGDLYVTFNSNQFKAVDNLNPTDDADIRYQLGNNEAATTSGWNVRSEDVRLQSAFKDAIAPIQEQVQELSNTINEIRDNIAPLRAMNEEEANEYATQTQEAFENEAAPIRNNLTEEENQRMDMLEFLERNNMMNEERRYEKEQLENKINPVYPTEEATPGQALSDIRDIDEVGKRDVKAYQYEHPEVKPYFQEEARGMLNDLNNSIKGERFINESQQRGQGTSYDVIGVKRFTSPEIAELLDSKYGYTYDDIRKGLNAIIEDHGAENIAIAKRIELVLDDNLRNGYTDWQTGTEIPPNQEYLNMLAEQEWQNYFDDINSQYPLDVNQVQYALEQERQQEEQYRIEKTLEEMTEDDINLEPFLSGLQGASERQAERQQLREELNQKREVKIPKQSDGRKAWNRFKSLVSNEFAVLDDYSKRTGNKDIKFKADTYNNYQAIAQSNIETAQTDINGKAIGRSGNSIIEEAKSLGLENTFDEYIKQWANVDRAKQGKGAANYSAQESYKIVKEMEAKYPVLKRLGKDMWQYYRNARHNLRDAGVISQEVSDMLGRRYPHYTPYISENIENYFTDEGKLKPKSTIKRAKGGAAIGSLLSVEEAMQRYTKSEFNTIFGNDLFREIVKTSNDIVQLGGDDRGMQFVNADNLYADKNGYYLTAYENGEPITARISEDMYKTLTRESRNRISDIENTFSAVTKPLQGLSKLRRNILTSWSPTFIFKNAIKDIQEAVFNSKYTADMLKNMPRAYKELVSNTEQARQFKSLYGSGLTMGQYDIDSMNYTPSGKNKTFLQGLKNIITGTNELVEIAPRYAEFLASIDHGASLQEAMYNAREVTTNFSRGGTLAKALNRNGFTFLNSSIQGFDKFIRNFSGENGAKGIVNSLAKAAIFGIAPAVFNELAFGSGDDKDEEYEALPDYIKDNYYIIKTGDGNFIRIPKGRVLSVFGSAARRTIEAMEGEENAFEGFLNNAWTQVGFNNPDENNIFAPLMQAYGTENGTNWYDKNQPIVPTRLQDKPKAEQYDAGTDAFSIWLGDKLGISPYKLNYVLDQYSGGIGDIFLPMITEEANSDGSIIAPIKDQFTADSTTDNKYVSDFYSKNDELTVNANSSKATDEDILKQKYMSTVSFDMGQLYKERREVQADKTLSKQEKYQKAQAIKDEINRMAKEALDNYENVNITGDYANINGMEYQKTDDGWKKVNSNNADTMNSLGLSDREKNNYTKTKQNISSIKEKYKDTDDYNGKKSEIIGEIINTNLDDNSKLSLYQDTYRDKLADSIDDLGINADTYLEYKAQDFSADKDKNGKSISGSKKRKVFDYINSLDIPYQQKIILAKSEYNSFNDNNAEIIEYIENTDMDYDERIELYKALGFKVDGDSISW